MIRAFAMDFDGVHTDNRVTIDHLGNEYISCNRSDGRAIEMLHAAGIVMCVISRSNNAAMHYRCKALDLRLFAAVKHKSPVLLDWLDDRGAPPEDACYIGNDVDDVPCLEVVGYPARPPDSSMEVMDMKPRPMLATLADLARHIIAENERPGSVWGRQGGERPRPVPLPSAPRWGDR